MLCVMRKRRKSAASSSSPARGWESWMFSHKEGGGVVQRGRKSKGVEDLGSSLWGEVGTKNAGRLASGARDV